MPTIFDACIVGTSPISLLAALKLAEDNKKIIIIEKSAVYGGAWSAENLSRFDGFETETACHLIEHYTGVYNKISNLSGVPFKYSNPQPVKIREGKAVSYFSLSTICKELIIHILILFVLPIIRITNLISPIKIKKAKGINYKLILNSILFNLRYRLPSILSYKGIMEPKYGYADFLKKLLDRVKSNDIEIIDAEFIDFYPQQSKLVDVNHDKGRICARKLYITESIEVGIESNIFNITRLDKTFKKNRYWHMTIEVNAFIGKSVPSYIHFPDDTILHRMTKDNTLNAKLNKNLFLIQVREDPSTLNLNKLKSSVIKTLSIFDVTTNEEDVFFYDVFEGNFYPSRRLPPFYKSQSANHVVIIPSIGDLARNIATNTLFD